MLFLNGSQVLQIVLQYQRQVDRVGGRISNEYLFALDGDRVTTIDRVAAALSSQQQADSKRVRKPRGILEGAADPTHHHVLWGKTWQITCVPYNGKSQYPGGGVVVNRERERRVA
jgi:hypothetical protein